MSMYFDPRLAGLEPYVPGEQPAAGAPYVKLNTNESPYPPAEAVTKAVAAEAPLLNRYPNPACTGLNTALAAWLGVEPACCFAGNGSDEILAFCFQAFAPNGATFPDLTYGFYEVYCQLYGVLAEKIPLGADFTIAPGDYAGKKGTVFLANPNAPTGLALPLEAIEVLLKQDKTRLVVVDEAYVHFGAQSAVTLLPKYDNLLVVGTFSKSRSLAGARLGYAAGSKAVINDLNRVKYSFNPYNLNRLTQAAGVAALNSEAYYNGCCEAIQKTREDTTAKIEKLGFTCVASKANFIFATHPGHGGQALYQQLKEKGVLVRWWPKPHIQNHLRITVGTPEEMAKLLQALGAIL